MGTSSAWNNPAGGDWDTPTDWSDGVPDSTTVDADLPTLTTAYTVNSTINETVAFLEVDPEATLTLQSGDFTVFSSLASYSNSYLLGTLNVDAGATMTFGKKGSPSGDSAEINGGAVGGGVGGVLDISSTSAKAATLADFAPWMGLYNGAQIELSGKARIIGATTGGGNTLENENATISGSGTIGNGAGATGGSGLWLTNAHDGTINANGAAALVINTGTNSIENAGTIENTGTGGLTIASLLYQDGELIDTGTGKLTLEAYVEGLGTLTIGKGAKAVLNNGGAGLDGEIDIGSTAAPGGSITTTAGNTLGVGTNNNYAGDVLQDGAIENTGTITVVNDSTLNINATLVNTGAGTLSIAGTTGPTTLEVFGDGLKLEGGTVLLSDSANNLLDSNGVGTQLSDFGTIRGAGTIGDTWLRLYVAPAGVVNADDPVGMTIVGDSAAVTAGTENPNYSAGTVETTAAGGLTIDGVFGNAGFLIASGAGALTLNGTQINTGSGVTETTGTGSIVLENNAAIYNQADLSISAGGTVSTTSGDWDDVIETSVYNNGAVNLANGSTLVVDGHWTGAGSVDLDGSTLTTALDIKAGQTWELIGGGTVGAPIAGTVSLTGTDNSIVSGTGASATNGTVLRNKSDTIQGSGTIGDAFMTIDNAVGATIDATGAGGLTLDAAPYNATTNSTYLNNGGTIESNSAGGLTIESAMYNTGSLIANTGGNIHAQDAVYGAGDVQINGSGSAEFGAELDNDVYFGRGSGGTLIFDNYGAPTGTSPFYGNIWGLVAGDSIDLRDFALSSGNMALGSNSVFGTLDGTLTVTNGTGTSSPLYLEGNYTAAYMTSKNLAWQFVSDGHEIGSTGTFGTEIKLVST